MPADLPAAVIALQHTHPHSPGLLPAIANARTGLAVRTAGPGDRLTPGTVLVPPPGYHLLVTADDTVLLIGSLPADGLLPETVREAEG